MLENTKYRWLDWAREIQSIAQTGLHYSSNEFDQDRYKRLTELAAEIIHDYSDLEMETLVGSFLRQNGYATPKVDVRAAVFREGKLLLVREVSDGKWSMPGGWMDVGDVPSQSAERETWEEAGFQVKARKLLAIYDANRGATGELDIYHAVKLLFLCELVGGNGATSHETSEIGFFGLNELPSLSGMRTTSRMIVHAFDYLVDPEKATVYD